MRRSHTWSWLLLAVLTLGLTGCVQLEEDITLDADGSGTYDLKLVWDQALLRRMVDLVGPGAAASFRGRDLPLTLEAWRDGLAGVEGVTVRTLTLEEGEGGERTLRVHLRFRHVRDLFLWEPFARRSFAVRRVDGESEDGPPRAELVMAPLTRIPYLDPLAAALAARRQPPSAETGGPRELDPPPFERLGISPRQAELAETLLRPQLARVRLAFRVRPPGALEDVGATGEATQHGALFTWDFAALASDRPRALRLAWTPRPFDPIPEVDHVGDHRSTVAGSR